jgi:5-methylcytosine-specific restriction protein A
MPTQPPAFRAPGARAHKPWQAQAAFVDKRKRGRAGMRERAAVLLEEPFCRMCLKQGREVRSEQVDHVKPLAWGGTDARSNKQALCRPCHEAKSKAERAAGG